MNPQPNAYKNITTATTTQVYTGQCTLVSITVNTTSAGTIKIIDGTSGTTANVATIAASVLPQTFVYNITMTNGIRIVTAGASDITVMFKN